MSFMPLGGAAGRQLTWWFRRVAPDKQGPGADSGQANDYRGDGLLNGQEHDEQDQGEDDAKLADGAPGG